MEKQETKKIRKRTTPKIVNPDEEKGLEFYLKKGQIKLLMSYIKSGSSNILILGSQKQISRFLYQFFETISEAPEKIFSKKIGNEFFAWKTISIYKNLYLMDNEGNIYGYDLAKKRPVLIDKDLNILKYYYIYES